MATHLVAMFWTALGLLVIVTLAGGLFLRKRWLLGASGVGIALGLGMLGATRFQLWAVPWNAGLMVLLAAMVALGVGALWSVRRKAQQ